jgi:hypothetical protein
MGGLLVNWSSHMEISRMSWIDLIVGDHPLAKWDDPSGPPARKIWCCMTLHISKNSNRDYHKQITSDPQGYG